MSNEEALKQLREPFPDSAVGKRPVITCGACSKADAKNCDKHKKTKCRTCGNFITTMHDHLDFVGHAFVTERLLNVDPKWSWEPVAFTGEGLPLLDSNGGLWIRLTICGVTRLGYGDADGKRGAKAVKEAIGDAIRNAGMRFGIALDKWQKDSPDTDGVPSREVERPVLSEEDERAQLRGQIFTVGKNKGMTASHIGDDFAEWSGGAENIRTAKVPDLRQYLAHLRSGGEKAA